MPIMNTVIKGGGTTPTGTLPITNNGTYDVTNYANADVQVPTSGPDYYIEKRLNQYGELSNPTTPIDLTGVNNLYGDYVLAYAYYKNLYLQGTGGYIDLRGPKYISGREALQSTFYGCYGIIQVDMSTIEEILGDSAMSDTFYGCTNLSSVDLSSLISITGNGSVNAFGSCSNLVSMIFPSLKTLTSTGGPFFAAFAGCSRLATLSFPALTPTSFGTSTDQFYRMLRYDENVTVHFPSNLQSVIGSWSDVTAGFAGSNTTVLFDLPATVILTGANSQAYERSPKDDTAMALAWRKQDVGTTIDWTPFYTSGTTDPAVSDTIYSDAACTTAVTTISSIA